MATQWVLLWWCFSAAFAGIVSDTIIESCPSESLLPQQPISAANEPREGPSIYMMKKSELGREMASSLESSSEDEFEDEYDEEGEYGWESEYEGVEEELEQEGEMNESDSAGLKEDRTPGPGDDLGVAQLIENTTISEAIYDRLAAARTYFREEVFVNDRYANTWSLCRNKEPLCATWAIEGECDNNPSFMKVNCAPVCFTCEMVHIDTRCVVDPSVGDALYPGDLNRMFERVLADPAMRFLLPKVLSRPYFASGDTPETADYQLGIWLVNFENFSTAEEADYLVEYGHSEGYKRSADVGEQLEDGTFGDSVNDGRTSTNAWCENECYNHTLAQAVMKRIEFITGIPEGNQEHLQLLHYQPGQYYRTHNVSTVIKAQELYDSESHLTMSNRTTSITSRRARLVSGY